MIDYKQAISPFEKSFPHYHRLFVFFILGGSFFFVVSLISFMLPLVLAILPAFSNSFELFDGFQNESVNWGQIARISGFTFFQAFCSASLAVIIGLLVSFFCALRQFPGRKFLLSLSAIPLSIPPLIIAISYVLFFGRNGILSAFLSFFTTGSVKIDFLYSIVGIIFVHGFYNFPIAMQGITKVWSRLDEDVENAAVLLGGSKVRIFFKIILPELVTPILSSFLLIFLYCFFSFMIILLFGGIRLSTLEVELYVAARTTLNIGYAGKIALIETSIAVILTIAYVIMLQKNKANVLELKAGRRLKKITGVGEKIFFIILMLTIFFGLIAPLLSIFFHSFLQLEHTHGQEKFLSIQPWINVLTAHNTWNAVFNTVIVGLSTAICSVFSALFFLYLNFKSLISGLEYKKKGQAKILTFILKFLPYAPLMVSSVIIGFGFNLLLKQGSIPILIAGQTATAWVFAYSQIQNSFRQINSSVLQASILFSENINGAFLRVVVPLCKPGIKSAFAFSFAVSAGDATLPLVLNIPRFENLSLLVFRLSGSYRFTESSVVAIILIILTGSVFFIQQTNKGVE